MHLGDGSLARAPAALDFIPSPDGLLFVTPGGRRTGLQFFDANLVLHDGAASAPRRVTPFYIDPSMTDQYPSVGVLSATRELGHARSVYRIMTSWFDRVVIRDYESRIVSSGVLALRPAGDVVHACRGRQLSLPVISPNGAGFAARDEMSGTTKLFRLSGDGACEELVDLGIQTGKVAWDPAGLRVSFSIPRGVVRDGSRVLWEAASSTGEEAGVFVFDPGRQLISRVSGSDGVASLAFPEFVGRDTVVFLLASADGERSVLRIVCCLATEHP
jgi:hypothetical protein